MEPKLIAIYFPQFHDIPENDTWWGKGFSDWDLVKSAKPLFENHKQPKIPLHEKYYDPCDRETLKAQAEMAKNYGISGFMFYHYWFDSKVILEKPLENFLKYQEIDIQFCLSWANDSWTRQWIGKNDVLLEQKHLPEIRLWEMHFNYLLPFFLDRRYIKIDGKPLFSIYSPDIVRKTKDMFEFWDILAKKNGLEGLYYLAIQSHEFPQNAFLGNYDSILKFQPREANTSNRNPKRQKFVSSNLFRVLPEKIRLALGNIRRKFKKSYTLLSARYIWEYVLDNAYKNNYPQYNLTVFESAFFNWDNTARYREKATIYSAITKKDKIKYLNRLYKIAKRESSRFIFFNAWNEWSESAYLEPDLDYGYENLEIIKKIFKHNIR